MARYNSRLRHRLIYGLLNKRGGFAKSYWIYDDFLANVVEEDIDESAAKPGPGTRNHVAAP